MKLAVWFHELVSNRIFVDDIKNLAMRDFRPACKWPASWLGIQALLCCNQALLLSCSGHIPS